MAESLILDPEVQAILEEVAADPRSVLRMPSPLASRAFFEEGSRPTVATAGLSSADRELLRVHRNELAWLLRQACLIKLVEGPGRTLVSRYVKADEECSLVPVRTLAERVEHEKTHSDERGADDSSEALSLLMRCIAGPLDSEPGVALLAAVSFRLEPTNQGRLLAAIDFVRGTRQQTAMRLAIDVLHRRPSDNHRVTALHCAATAYVRAAQFEAAYNVYAGSDHVGDEHVLVHMNRFIFALQAGMRREALDAAQCLGMNVQAGHPVLNWFISSLTLRRDAHEWQPTRQAHLLTASLHADLGEVARRIAHVTR